MLICTKCGLRMVPVQIGVVVDLMTNFGSYQLWAADRFDCPECMVSVLLSSATRPVQEHYQPQYDDARSQYAQHGILYTTFGTLKEKERYQNANVEVGK